MRCPSLSLSPLDFLGALMKKAPANPWWQQFRERNTVLTHSCRTAIFMLKEALDLQDGDEVLMAAYNCGSEVDALIASGLTVSFVDCDAHGMVSLDALKAARSDATKAIYVIHPFGWLQPLADIRSWCAEETVWLVEDCALALLSQDEDGYLAGIRSDAAVYSLPKSLAVPDGGILATRPKMLFSNSLTRPDIAMTGKGLARLVKSWLSAKKPLSRLSGRTAEWPASVLQEILEDMPSDYYFEDWRRNVSCSSATMNLIDRYDFDKATKVRRQNYLTLAQSFENGGIQMLFEDLPDGTVPLNCPIVIDGRDEIVKILSRQGIYSTPWWAGGHRCIDWRQFPNARRLKQVVLPLPIHDQLNTDHMQYLAQVVIEGVRSKPT